MLSELITLTLALGILYGLHQRIKAIRSRGGPRQAPLLDKLEFDPARHELIVTLRDGTTVTGTPEARGIGSAISDGLILADAITNQQADALRTIMFIPGHNIRAIGTTDREANAGPQPIPDG